MYKVEFIIKGRGGTRITKAEYCQTNCEEFARAQYYETQFNNWINNDFKAWAPGVANLPPDLADFRRKLFNISNSGIIKAAGNNALADVLGIKTHILVSNIKRLKYAGVAETALFRDRVFKGIYIKL